MRRPRRNTSPLMKMNFALGFSGGALALINEATIPGRDIAISNTSAGTRKSIFPGVADRAPNTVDLLTRANLPIIGVMNGAENLVDTDLTNWTPFRFTTPDASTIREDATTNTRVVRYYATSSNTSAVVEVEPVGKERIQLEIDEPPGTGSSVEYELTGLGTILGTVNGATGSIKLMSDGYYRLTFAGGALTNFFDIRGLDDSGNSTYTGDTGKGYNVRNVRAVDSAVAHAGFPDGSAAAATYATDLPSCTPSFGSAGTIVQVAIPYGYSGADNPVSDSARLFNVGSSDMKCLTPSNIRLEGLLGSPNIQSGESMSDGVVTVMSSDWDGSEFGLRVDNTYSRTTASGTLTPGVMYIGNRSAADRPLHGGLLTLIFDRVLSDTEYEALRIYLNTVFGGLIFD